MTTINPVRSLVRPKFQGLGWLAQGLAFLMARVGGTVQQFLDVQDARRQLRQMDAAILRDIGISHGEMDFETRRPIWDLHMPFEKR